MPRVQRYRPSFDYRFPYTMLEVKSSNRHDLIRPLPNSPIVCDFTLRYGDAIVVSTVDAENGHLFKFVHIHQREIEEIACNSKHRIHLQSESFKSIAFTTFQVCTNKQFLLSKIYPSTQNLSNSRYKSPPQWITRIPEPKMIETYLESLLLTNA